jgi:uncharacterized membrane protein
MKNRRIITIITAALFFIAFAEIIVSSATGQDMMQGNNSGGMATWNWIQSLISCAIGILIGFLFGFLTARRKT